MASDVFGRLCRDIRELCPPVLPLRIRRVVMDGAHASCRLVYTRTGQPSHFLIQIDRTLPASVACHFLIHEVAHALAWQDGQDIDDHGEEWGLALARVYRQCWES